MTRAFIISIGDELTKGETINTNAAYISIELVKRGIEVSSVLTLPDEYDTCVRYMGKILQERGIYIITGGLGGTRDDITRRVICGVLKKNVYIDGEKAKELKKWYLKRGREFTESDRLQASCPEGGRLLENGVGLAFGFFIVDEGRYIFALPGVPKEMKNMFENEVIPLLAKENFFNSNLQSSTLLFAGIAEYTLDKHLSEIILKYKGIHYGTRVSYGLIRVRVESRNNEIEPCIREITSLLDSYFINRDERKIEQVAGDLLIKNHLTLSTAESCTAGWLSKVITDVPGSSEYFKGGVVAYSNEVKEKMLGVKEKTLKSYGAVSSRTAGEMAGGARKLTGSDIGLSITGIAGPSGGTVDKPAGTVFICLSCKGQKPETSRNLFAGDRDTVRLRSVNKALFMLFKFLKGMDLK
ncbi:MAG: CinA family nicotinamide mononucleotide deamidase-related protein [Spirochaetes bacterium]|nr:CinA family nicotinamide mononucleotide deamidase-related protein [Spirochaetota bacterium]